ncbi:MAG: hypothetical protein JWN67_3179 [Actinomycetia bacterium]|nr:hypothetical protein [Actinomycetes bacterium]
MRYGLLTWVVLVTIAAYLVRTVIVLIAKRRLPRASDFVDRWWAWTPLAVVLVAITIAAWPIGLALIVGTGIALGRSTATGSPFRPRR